MDQTKRKMESFLTFELYCTTVFPVRSCEENLVITAELYTTNMMYFDNLDSLKQKIFFLIDKLSPFNRTVSSGSRENVFHVIFIHIFFFIILFLVSTDVMCL